LEQPASIRERITSKDNVEWEPMLLEIRCKVAAIEPVDGPVELGEDAGNLSYIGIV
jgi:hypothetical protein